MDSTGVFQNRRAGAVLLVILFGLGLAWLGLTGLAWGKVTEEWVQTFEGSERGYDYPNSIHVDQKGNVYVTGVPSIVKYSPDGLELWNLAVPSRASCLDGQGNLYVTGIVHGTNGRNEYGISKYDTHGKLLWEARYHGPKNYNESPRAIAVDSQGYVYVTGASWVIPSIVDYATIKYSPDGVLLWAARYHGPSKMGIDQAQAIAVDGQGNVYVTGSSRALGKHEVDYATIKYRHDGEELWVSRYNGAGKWHDFATAMAVDGQGNVYVTGYSYGTRETSYDYATIKYTPDGQELWVRRYNGMKGGDDEARAIAIDSLGNVYVTGNYATIKYSPDGQKLWVRRYPGSVSSYNGARAMVLDNQDNVYVTGRSNHEYSTIKYSPDGRQLWVKRLNGPEGGLDGATAIAVDDYGHVYVTGFIDWQWPDSIMNYCTIKYRQRGRCITDLY